MIRPALSGGASPDSVVVRLKAQGKMLSAATSAIRPFAPKPDFPDTTPKATFVSRALSLGFNRSLVWIVRLRRLAVEKYVAAHPPRTFSAHAVAAIEVV